MRERTIKINSGEEQIDVCKQFPVILFDYQIGAIEWNDFDEPVSRENTITFMADQPLDEWWHIIKNMNALFNQEKMRIIYPDEINVYQEGKATITKEWHERGSYFFEVTQVTDGYKYDLHEITLSTRDKTLRTDQKTNFYEVNNKGTAPCRFKIWNVSQRENGYFSIITEDQYFALGDSEEADRIKIPNNKLVVNEEMDDMNSWTFNEVQPPMDDCFATGGFKETKWGSTLSDVPIPSNQPQKTWFGPSAIKRFNLDELNEQWASSFHAVFKFAARSTDAQKQGYRAIVGLLDQDKKFMFFLDMRDGATNSLNTQMFMYHMAAGTHPNHKMLITQNSGRLNQFVGDLQIQKHGDKVRYWLFHTEASHPKWKNMSKRWSFYRELNHPQFAADGRLASYVFVWLGRTRNMDFYNDFEVSQVRVFKKFWDGNGEVTNLLGPNDIFYLNTKDGRPYFANGVGESDPGLMIPISQYVNPGSETALQLKPGVNHIHIDRSSWYRGNDEVTISFRQRYY